MRTRIVTSTGSARQQMLLNGEGAARAESADRLKTTPTPEEMEPADRDVLEELIRMVSEGVAEPTERDKPEED